MEDTYLLCPAPVLREVGMYVLFYVLKFLLCLRENESMLSHYILLLHTSNSGVISCACWVNWHLKSMGERAVAGELTCTKGFSVHQEPEDIIEQRTGLAGLTWFLWFFCREAALQVSMNDGLSFISSSVIISSTHCVSLDSCA